MRESRLADAAAVMLRQEVELVEVDLALGRDPAEGEIADRVAGQLDELDADAVPQVAPQLLDAVHGREHVVDLPGRQQVRVAAAPDVVGERADGREVVLARGTEGELRRDGGGRVHGTIIPLRVESKRSKERGSPIALAWRAILILDACPGPCNRGAS